MAIHPVSGMGPDHGTYTLSISYLPCCDRRSSSQMERSTTRGPDRCFVSPLIQYVCISAQLELPMLVKDPTVRML